jgi:hypothetical protein
MRILFLTVLLTVTAKAQGTIYFWEWHSLGVSQTFHASFEVTEAEMQPGVVFNSDLFYNSIYFTNILSGYEFRYDAPWSSVQGSLDFINMVHHDAAHTASLSMYAQGPGPQFAGAINEADPDGRHWGQQGYWQYEAIPEPSVMGLCVVGAAVCFINRRKRCER